MISLENRFNRLLKALSASLWARSGSLASCFNTSAACSVEPSVNRPFSPLVMTSGIPPTALAQMRRAATNEAAMQPVRVSKPQINTALQALEDQYVIIRATDAGDSISTAIDAANTALGGGALVPGWTAAEKQVLEKVWMPWKSGTL